MDIWIDKRKILTINTCTTAFIVFFYAKIKYKNNKKYIKYTNWRVKIPKDTLNISKSKYKIKENKELAEKATILIERKDVIYKTRATIDIVEI